METVDLNWFVPDCRFQAQQIALLQSMRQSPNDRFAAGLANMIGVHRIVTNPRVYVHNRDIAQGQINWMIDQHLWRLRQC